MKNTFLCIIPARGGSRGIPDKNIIDINGKPLISYVINAVKKSNICDRIVVTTDSEEIAKVAKEYGADVPFLRPKYLATDESLTGDTVVHALKYIEKNDKKYDYVCYIQPTSPLLTSQDIQNSINLLFDKKADMVVSVGESPINIYWAKHISQDLSMKNFAINVCETNKQLFDDTYFLNGALYIGKWDIFYEKKNYYDQKTYAYTMPYERSIDLDNFFDLKLIKFLLKERNKSV